MLTVYNDDSVRHVLLLSLLFVAVSSMLTHTPSYFYVLQKPAAVPFPSAAPPAVHQLEGASTQPPPYAQPPHPQQLLNPQAPPYVPQYAQQPQQYALQPQQYAQQPQYDGKNDDAPQQSQ
jgi:hypothetical protein